MNGGSGERSSNGNRTNGTKADNERQGSSSSSGNSSSKTGGKGAGGGGAIIESMHHHGKGVYSGTFSGNTYSETFCNNPLRIDNETLEYLWIYGKCKNIWYN